jgi:putative hydrolase of the HAD superfamily
VIPDRWTQISALGHVACILAIYHRLHLSDYMDPWVVFDADNTLWEVESLYDDARRSLIEILAARGIDRSLSGEIQQTIDQNLHRSLGYSAERFPTSFDRTLTYFFPDASNQEREQIKAVAERVFLQPAVVHEALEQVITTLCGRYRLGILTAGERWVQESRLRQFIYHHHFSAIEIVPHKDAASFVAFAQKNAVDTSHSWLVGDSIRSDIIPGHAAGFNCILLRAHNWRRVEIESMTLPPDVFQVTELSEILSIIPLNVS